MEIGKPDTGLNTWAIVEVMGHTVYAGLVTEQTVASQSFIRVDVPAMGDQSAFTKLLGSGSIFSITPCEEVIARGMIEHRRTSPPIQALCLPLHMREQLRLGQQVMDAQKGASGVPQAPLIRDEHDIEDSDDDEFDEYDA